jgi:plastocyanin
MRWLPLVVGALLSASAPSATVGSFELTGTVHAGGRPKGDAVVWLEPANGQVAAQAAKATKVVLDQRTLTFFPRVLAVQVGTTVDLPNNDRVFHNVFSFHDGKKFDLGLYPVGTSRRVTFAHSGLSRIFCNIHPNMAAYVMTVDSPYHGVSDSQGRFTIASVPPGAYTYHAWRAGAPEVTGATTVEAGKPLEIAWP